MDAWPDFWASSETQTGETAEHSDAGPGWEEPPKKRRGRPLGTTGSKSFRARMQAEGERLKQQTLTALSSQQTTSQSTLQGGATQTSQASSSGSLPASNKPSPWELEFLRQCGAMSPAEEMMAAIPDKPLASSTVIQRICEHYLGSSVVHLQSTSSAAAHLGRQGHLSEGTSPRA